MKHQPFLRKAETQERGQKPEEIPKKKKPERVKETSRKDSTDKNRGAGGPAASPLTAEKRKRNQLRVVPLSEKGDKQPPRLQRKHSLICSFVHSLFIHSFVYPTVSSLCANLKLDFFPDSHSFYCNGSRLLDSLICCKKESVSTFSWPYILRSIMSDTNNADEQHHFLREGSDSKGEC